MVPLQKYAHLSLYLILWLPTQLEYRKSPQMGEQTKWFQVTRFIIKQRVIQWLKHWAWVLTVISLSQAP